MSESPNLFILLILLILSNSSAASEKRAKDRRDFPDDDAQAQIAHAQPPFFRIFKTRTCRAIFNVKHKKNVSKCLDSP
jgi:hypothetical protein